MSYFSRLTDIVTCNLSELLARENDPAAALAQIVAEMEEGLAGAKRSVKTAADNVSRLEQELADLRVQINQWVERAKQHLADNNEVGARAALTRKREQEDLIAGLEQQLTAAISTREQLQTTLRALEARLADARRRESESTIDDTGKQHESPAAATESASERNRDIDDELEALRRQLGNP